MEQTKSQESKKTFYLVLIIVLVILNAFFAYNHWAARKQVKQIEAQRNELDSLYTNALTEINAKQVGLDSLKGINGELDSLISVRQKELDDKKQQIEELLKENKLTKNQLSHARKLISSLKEENKKYIAQIDSLTGKVEFLTLLSDSLATGLKSQMAENEQLLSEKEVLSEKATLGSLLKPENVEASGIRYKSNNREVPTNSSKKTEKLRVCFDVPENKIADPGEKTILLRILNPQGSTVAVNSEGSGTFELAETGETKQYTMKASFDYGNRQKNICVYWSQTAAFSRGTYKVDFYQDGYFLKEQTFELK